MSLWERCFFKVESCSYENNAKLLLSVEDNIDNEDAEINKFLAWLSLSWEQDNDKIEKVLTAISVINTDLSNGRTPSETALTGFRAAAEALDYTEVSAFMSKARWVSFMLILAMAVAIVALALIFPPPLIVYPMYGWIIVGKVISAFAIQALLIFKGVVLSEATPQEKMEICALRIERDIEADQLEKLAQSAIDGRTIAEGSETCLSGLMRCLPF